MDVVILAQKQLHLFYNLFKIVPFDVWDKDSFTEKTDNMYIWGKK